VEQVVSHQHTIWSQFQTQITTVELSWRRQHIHTHTHTQLAEDISSYGTCEMIWINVTRSVGISRIFSGVHFFSSKSWRPFFSCHFQHTGWNCYINHSHSPVQQKFPHRFDFLLHLHLRVHLQLTPINYAQRKTIFFPPWG